MIIFRTLKMVKEIITQVLDADPKITKENDFRFFTRNCQSIVDLFSFNKISV